MCYLLVCFYPTRSKPSFQSVMFEKRSTYGGRIFAPARLYRADTIKKSPDMRAFPTGGSAASRSAPNQSSCDYFNRITSKVTTYGRTHAAKTPAPISGFFLTATPYWGNPTAIILLLVFYLSIYNYFIEFCYQT